MHCCEDPFADQTFDGAVAVVVVVVSVGTEAQEGRIAD